MAHLYNGHRVIWESKVKQIRIIGVCLLFVASAIWTRQQYSPFAFWFSLLFFGGGGCFMLCRLLNPTNLFVSPDSKLGIDIRKALHKQMLEKIVFYEGGFTLPGNSNIAHRRYDWKELQTAFGYKIDLYTTDEICLDLFWEDGNSLTISEGTLHWEDMLAELNKNLPDIPQSWYTDISVPVFETTLTLLFDKLGRSQEEAEQDYYG